MTYQEYFIQLRIEFTKATNAYIEAEKKLTNEPTWMERKALEDFYKAKIHWQHAANNYSTFLDFAKMFEVKPTDLML